MSGGPCSVTETARAKLNLTLDVLGKRPDGYHDIESVMQTVELADVVELEDLASPGEVRVETDLARLPTGPENLACRAAMEMICAAGVREHRGVRLCLKKRIPVAAGLGGGSADAAAVLRGLNQLWALGLGDEELRSLGRRIGADVPFLVTGGTALARGVGELIRPLVPLRVWVVIATPPVEVSTRSVYALLDSRFASGLGGGAFGDAGRTALMAKAIEDGRLGDVGRLLFNALEPVVSEKWPIVAGLRRDFENAGVIGSSMTGSGPSVFAIVGDQDDAKRVAERVQRPGIEVWVGRTQ